MTNLKMLRGAVLVLLGLIPIVLFVYRPAPLAFDTPLIIKTQAGISQRLYVAVADMPKTWDKGLMGVDVMESRNGMLFLFGKEATVKMWMKDTHIPLDMLFINKDNKVVGIVKQTQPNSDAIIDPGMPVYAVLEINGGQADKLGLSTGDTAVFVGTDTF